MKYEWKKEEKHLYMPKDKPEKITVPKYKYFVIKGQGTQYDEDFILRKEVLFRVSNTIKLMPKRGFYPGGYFEYSLYPLEILWNGSEYEMMIRQPEFVTGSVARMAVTGVISTNPHPLINEVNFLSSGDCVGIQILHIGGRGTEEGSFEILNKFADENGLEKSGRYREIYINDPQKTTQEKLKRIIRIEISEKLK